MGEAVPVRKCRRRYYRIPSVVPVDFQLLSDSQEPLDPEIRTGFTRDLSRGGLCLRITSLSENLARHFEERADQLRIHVDLRLPSRALRVRGRVVWSQKMLERARETYLVGVEFIGLTPGDSDALETYARHAAARPRIIRGVVLSLGLLAVVASGLYFWGEATHRAEMNRSKQALAAKTAEWNEMAAQLERLWVDVRWIATEVGEMASDLQEQEGGNAGGAGEQGGAADSGYYEPEIIGPAIQDLSSIVAKLRAAILKMKRAKTHAPKE